MKIAILADIHGNDQALKTVLKDTLIFDISSFFVLGDNVGYYYWPKECLELLSKLPQVEMIQGNHEKILTRALNDIIYRDTIKKKYGHGIEYAINNLSNEKIDYLTNLPSKKELHIDGKKVLLCHGSPDNNEEYLYPDTSLEILRKATSCDFDYIFLGHSHYPFVHHDNNRVLVNPGSVGQPRDIGSLASYIIFDTQNNTLQFRRVSFSNEKIINMINQIDPSVKYLQTALQRNINAKDDDVV